MRVARGPGPAPAARPIAPLEKVEAAAYAVPTETVESDGTARWRQTTLVVVHAFAGGRVGLGYTYAPAVAASLVYEPLAGAVLDQDVMSPCAALRAMLRSVRNAGRGGVMARAMSAIDVALWDLKAKLLGVPLVDLIGLVHPRLPVYGSGGFTNYDERHLREQLEGWMKDGCEMMKIKIGEIPSEDPRRVEVARQVLGPDRELFVDANGAFHRAAARATFSSLEAHDVCWFEEPVSSDDLRGLAELRAAAPPTLAITAGEYGEDPWYFEQMLGAHAVDVLMADATRCLGVTGMLEVSALSDARHVPLSTHTAPALHLGIACALPPAIHMEYFHDHVRIERGLFDGFPPLIDGHLAPQRREPGLGLRFKEADARPVS